jgi:hypothetical protein
MQRDELKQLSKAELIELVLRLQRPQKRRREVSNVVPRKPAIDPFFAVSPSHLERLFLPHLRHSTAAARPSQLGGYLPLAPVVSTVRYPIPERIFDYVSAVQSATAGTCHEPTSALAVQSPSRRGRVRVGGIPRAFDKARAFHLPVSLLVNATREAT